MISVWLEKVVKSANEICGNSIKDTIIIERGIEKENYYGEIKIPQDSSKKNIECLVMAIDKNIGNAPDIVRAVLLSYKKELEGRLEGLTE